MQHLVEAGWPQLETVDVDLVAKGDGQGDDGDSELVELGQGDVARAVGDNGKHNAPCSIRIHWGGLPVHMDAIVDNATRLVGENLHFAQRTGEDVSGTDRIGAVLYGACEGDAWDLWSCC